MDVKWTMLTHIVLYTNIDINNKLFVVLYSIFFCSLSWKPRRRQEDRCKSNQIATKPKATAKKKKVLPPHKGRNLSRHRIVPQLID